jgi:2-phosphoglycerate kinase
MTAYEIKLYNEETRRYKFLAMVTANSKEEAKQKFIDRINYEPRDGFQLFVKSPGCL